MSDSEDKQDDGELWPNEKLGRGRDAEILTKYLLTRFEGVESDNSSTFILNINTDWGNGKTYFLTNWKKELIEKGYLVAYYDAWKNDDAESPLLSFLTDIEQQLSDALGESPLAKSSFDTAMEYGKTAAIKSLPIVLNMIVKSLVGVSLITPGSTAEEEKAASTDAADYGKLADAVAKNLIDNYKIKSSSTDGFKSLLSEFVNIADSEVDFPGFTRHFLA